MKAYMVSYDLIKRKDYPELWKALRAFNGYLHLLGSSWIVMSDDSANVICTALEKHIDGDDRLIVNEVGSNSSWTVSFSDEARKWLKKHLWGV